MTPKQRAGSLAIAGAALLAFVGGWEGEKLPVYADKLAGGLPTVCSGHTGPDVRLGDVWTEGQCDEILVKDIEKHGNGILSCIPVQLNQNEYEAYTSLAFNLGVGAVCNSSIPKKLVIGDRLAACNTILEFNKVRDRKKPKVYNQRKKVWEYPLVPVRGLTLRRHAERDICVKPVPVQSAKAVA